MDNSKSGHDKPIGHVGIIIEVMKDKNGKVIGLQIIDSGGTPGSGKSGLEKTIINLGGNKYWDKRVTGVYKWDKKPDKKK